MIINILFFLINEVLQVFSLFFPSSNGVILHIPFGIDEVLVSVVSTWNAFMETFPYAQTAWHILLVFILPFEIGMLILKLILGSRTPVAVN